MASVPSGAGQPSPVFAADRQARLGPYQIHWQAAGRQLTVRHLRAGRPARVLWQSLPGQPLFSASAGEIQHHENRGSLQLHFAARQHCEHVQLQAFQATSQAVTLSGQLSGPPGSACNGRFSWRFSLPPDADASASSELPLQVNLVLQPSEPVAIDQIWLELLQARDQQVAWRGLGVQPSVLDLRGGRFPLWVQEGGIGRGAQPLTGLINLFSPGSGGETGSSYFPLPFFWSDQLQAQMIQGYQPLLIDFSTAGLTRIQHPGLQAQFELFTAESPLELLTAYSARHGRQPRLPDWLHRGAIVGMQGGTQRVQQVAETLLQRQTPISAFWLQDWVGRRRTAIGSQLWWNWERDTAHYPDWSGLRERLQSGGIRLLGYVNPFLVDVSPRQPRRNLYAEAAAKDLLVRDAQGGIYPVQNTDFSAGLLDLSQPEARDWFREVLRDALRQANGFSGWMADYAEALPLDARLADADAWTFHNRYPVLWSQLQAEALADSDGIFFARAGYSGSTALTPLFWLGDQMVSWDAHDGLHSALTGLLSGGLSGIAVSHSDAGGYTSVAAMGLTRSRELLFRWLELNTFSAVLRTHEGNEPAANAQIYDDAETLAFFDRCARIYAALFSERQRLLDQASHRGWPLVRHPLLHYGTDPVVRQLSDQFMLGDQLMLAPVLQPGQRVRRLYLPAGQWVHLWSQRVYGHPARGSWVQVIAPLGFPPLFYPLGSASGQALYAQLAAEGLLQLDEMP
ncbi:MAG: alpha-glucosidase [Candidatus Sericytochromatia bacterium]|nr:alpha-glucosidase [Candidatus Sericytochromatia bacterium]